MPNSFSGGAKTASLLSSLQKLNSQKSERLVDIIYFNSADEDYTSASIAVSKYRHFTLLIDLIVGNTPTDIVFRVQLSDDNITFRNLMNGPFGDLRYEDSAGSKNEAIMGELCSPYMRIYVLSSGCSVPNVFNATVTVIMGS